MSVARFLYFSFSLYILSLCPYLLIVTPFKRRSTNFPDVRTVLNRTNFSCLCNKEKVIAQWALFIEHFAPVLYRILRPYLASLLFRNQNSSNIPEDYSGCIAKTKSVQILKEISDNLGSFRVKVQHIHTVFVSGFHRWTSTEITLIPRY